MCCQSYITDIEAKYVYAEALMKKRCCWPKVVHWDLIDAHFLDNDVGDVVMIESITQDNKSFRIFFVKDPDYVINIMAS